jgi:S-adenosylmethionine-diacylglycerol 3-amino-3-carboxypropyl transferase
MVATLARREAPSALPTPATELVYGHVREDPALEMSLVEQLAEELGRPVRVAVVASGGCTALLLLSSPHVAHIDAIDLNPAQLHLVELKRAAIARLEPGAQRTLLWGDDDDMEERFRLYERVRELLPEASREHWDARQDEIGFGPVRAARFEGLCRELSGAFCDEGLDPTRRPAEALGHPAWRDIFGRVFDRSRLASSFGTASVAYSTERSMSAHFSRALAEALRRSSAEGNYLLEQVFSADAAALAPVMQPDAQRRMKELGLHRLALHRGTLIGCLSALSAEAPYDLVQTSDVTDWLPLAERSRLLRSVKEALAPGGALLARRLNSDGELMPLAAQHFEVDAALSASFTARERSFLYREVVVARRGKHAVL